MRLVYSFLECSARRLVVLSMKRKKLLVLTTHPDRYLQFAMWFLVAFGWEVEIKDTGQPDTLVLDDLGGPPPTPEAIERMKQWYEDEMSRHET